MKTARSRSPKLNVTFRVSRAYLDWLDRLARYDRSPVASSFDKAMVAYGKVLGFDEPPPARTSRG